MLSSHDTLRTNKFSSRKTTESALLAGMRWSLGLVGELSPDWGAALAERVFATPRKHPARTKEQAALAKARRYEIQDEGMRLVTWTWGQSAKQVLLVHGWSGRGSQLHEFVDPLLEAGYSVVTFDAPAHGASGGSQASLFTFADAIRLVDRYVGPFDAVIGHSFGGTAVLLALQSGFETERAVVIGSPSRMEPALAQFAQLFGLDEALVGQMQARLERRFGVKIEDLDFARQTIKSSTPLLVVHDENDREVPLASGMVIAKAWPDARVMRTTGLGHFKVLRDVGVISEVVRFVAADGLKSLSRRTSPYAS